MDNIQLEYSYQSGKISTNRIDYNNSNYSMVYLCIDIMRTHIISI